MEAYLSLRVIYLCYIGGRIGVDAGIRKMIKVLQLKFLCDGQGTDKRAFLHVDRSCSSKCTLIFFKRAWISPHNLVYF